MARNSDLLLAPGCRLRQRGSERVQGTTCPVVVGASSG
jgi:hypothetical protein